MLTRRSFFGLVSAVVALPSAWRTRWSGQTTPALESDPAVQPCYRLIAELPTADQSRPFEIHGSDGVTISGTVPSNAGHVTAIRIYRST